MRESPAWSLPLTSFALIGLIHAYDRPVPEDSLSMEHRHPPFAAWLVRRGRVTVRFADAGRWTAPVVARENQWLFLPARHRIHKMAAGTHLLSVRMQLERAHETPLLAAPHPLCVSERQIPNFARLTVGLVRANEGQNVEDSGQPEGKKFRLQLEVAIRAAFLGWFEAYLDIVLARGWHVLEDTAWAGTTEKVLLWMEQRGFSDPLRQSEIARHLGMSVSHLKRLFRRDVGVTPIAWWQNRRLKEAYRLLRGTEHPLKVVSDCLGFHFPSHFSLWFRKETGMSPSEFRGRLEIDV